MIQLAIKAPIGREYDGQEFIIKCMDPGVSFAVSLYTMESISPWREMAVPYQIPNGSTAKLRVTRPDRAYTVTKAIVGEDGTILCPLHPYSVATPGKCSADVVVYGPDGNRLTSATFHFFVDRECAPTSGEDMPVYVDSIQGLIEFVEQSVDRAEKATARAESAEYSAQRAGVSAEAAARSEEAAARAAGTAQSASSQAQTSAQRAETAQAGAEDATSKALAAAESANRNIESLGIINLYVCSEGEYTADGPPTISEPDEKTTYLVPQDNEGTLYATWVYANGAWEFVEMLTVTLDEAEGEKGDPGKDGADGVGISSIRQTTVSTADGGNNVFTVTLTNGTSATFTVKNGTKGSAGAAGSPGKDGYTPVKGKDYFTEADKTEMVNAVIAALPVYDGEVEAV